MFILTARQMTAIWLGISRSSTGVIQTWLWYTTISKAADIEDNQYLLSGVLHASATT